MDDLVKRQRETIKQYIPFFSHNFIGTNMSERPNLRKNK